MKSAWSARTGSMDGFEFYSFEDIHHNLIV